MQVLHHCHQRIKSIQNAHNSKHHLVLKIANLIEDAKHKIIIQWLPSHVGIPGNEKADFLAREALNLNFITNLPAFYKDLTNKITLHYHKSWKHSFTNTDHGFANSFSFINPIPFNTLNNRFHQTRIARLLLRASKLSHSHLFEGKPPPTCDLCETINSVEHIFVWCPLFALQRRDLERISSARGEPLSICNLLSGSFPLSGLVKFLIDTNTINLI